jgi:hypothetical protein
MSAVGYTGLGPGRCNVMVLLQIQVVVSVVYQHNGVAAVVFSPAHRSLCRNFS